ncbi:MAG: hypothetical protein JSS49_20785 [Planctomycetes bacterium]|nr:hypothetical protein [Planctomycetota bacterium]
MFNHLWHLFVLIPAVACVVAAQDVAPQKPLVDVPSLDGLWSGSWGGGQRDGVVFQPVLAEMAVQGELVELRHFRNADRGRGRFQLDQAARRIRISLEAENKSPPRIVEFQYQWNGDKLTLTDNDQVPVVLSRQPAQKNAHANVAVQLVIANAIKETGDLSITEFSVLQSKGVAVTVHQPVTRSLSTKDSVILQLQETGVKKITLDEARGLLSAATPVVITYRNARNTGAYQSHELWTNLGLALPDSEAALRTYARLLRPGTLIFVLPEEASVPVP